MKTVFATVISYFVVLGYECDKAEKILTIILLAMVIRMAAAMADIYLNEMWNLWMKVYGKRKNSKRNRSTNPSVNALLGQIKMQSSSKPTVW